MTTPKRILVTGASGFLGRQVADAFSADCEVVRQGFRQAEDMVCCDLREADAVRALVAAARPDWIIHCAAYRDPDFCETHPEDARKLNVGATQHLIEATPIGGRMLFVSSDYVFDGSRPPYAPTDTVCPVNVYGLHKAESEAIVAQDPGNLVVRIPVLVGPDPVGVRGFLTQMTEDARSGEPRMVDNVLVRCPTHIADVAEAFRFLVARDASGIWHASASFSGTRFALTLEVAKALHLPDSHLQPSDTVIPRAARRPVNARLDSGMLRDAGFTGLRGLPELLMSLSS